MTMSRAKGAVWGPGLTVHYLFSVLRRPCDEHGPVMSTASGVDPPSQTRCLVTWNEKQLLLTEETYNKVCRHVDLGPRYARHLCDETKCAMHVLESLLV